MCTVRYEKALACVVMKAEMSHDLLSELETQEPMGSVLRVSPTCLMVRQSITPEGSMISILEVSKRDSPPPKISLNPEKILSTKTFFSFLLSLCREEIGGGGS